MPKTKSNRSLSIEEFLNKGNTSSCCKKCKRTWSNINPDEYIKHVDNCRGMQNVVPIPSAGKGHPLATVMEKNEKKKERAKKEKMKNSIANDEKRARAAARAPAEGKKKAAEAKGGKKGKKIIGNFCFL